MSFDVEKIYSLLPAFYRIQDINQGKALLTDENRKEIKDLTDKLATLSDQNGNEAKHIRHQIEEKKQGPLKALLSLISDQVAVFEEDLEQLYDDQFIETCAEWAVSYIGNLVGVRGMVNYTDAPFSQRAQVANTLAYRRRKGTAAVLEQLARDVTRWEAASVVEYFQLLATTQYMNHIRPDNASMASLRDWEQLELFNTPFDKIARTIDVRRIETRRGKYNIPNIGIFLWRLRSYQVTKTPAYKLDNRRYRFNGLGIDSAIYNNPESEREISHLAEPINVPMSISRRVLHEYLNTYYGKGKSLFLIVDDEEIEADEIIVCDLSDEGANLWVHMPLNMIAIDPFLGRIALPESIASPPSDHKVTVSYHYGFSADMGGGEYDRTNTFDNFQRIIKVPDDNLPDDSGTIQDAINQLNESGGVVLITNNKYYIESPVIKLAPGVTIEIRAANEKRPILVLEDELKIFGGEHSNLILNGLLVSGGRLRVPMKDSNNNANLLSQLSILHCTLLPGSSQQIDGVPAQPAMPRLIVESRFTETFIDKSIIGGIRAIEGAQVNMTNSILDAKEDTNVAYSGYIDDMVTSPPFETLLAGATLTAENCTVIGKVYAAMFKCISNSIFKSSLEKFDLWPAAVMADRLQDGCVRFSYIPLGSKVPRKYKCHPINTKDKFRVLPLFTSLNYGDAGYCQLATNCAVEIRHGADDEAEMGAFHDLYQPQREANLRARLDEYLHFGMEAGIFYAT
ncbi:tRNA-dihydrouridine synthase [Candidatus Scalindua japonica]|uniref:tRNA-dihydrouridine synthase n=1 Tax=Candidatus Scalindua japonica TaxID=1284222 RepID=A0A286TW67_9BACT|nr:hypothetical protein [Candidatus Scalindua japonica]GAX60138.1 tRNA-dihydrouridine synthase [Candidatus Scalindua japonica]